MQPVNFELSNRVLQPSHTVYSEDITGVIDLPVWTNREQCVSCWRMSWRERLSALLFGRVWLAVLSGETQPPVCIHAERKYLAVAPWPP